MAKDKMGVVYWAFNPEEAVKCYLSWLLVGFDIISAMKIAAKMGHGYVGVTSGSTLMAVRRRKYAEICLGVVPRDSEYLLLHYGQWLECLYWEHTLRPFPYIGWNRAVGGDHHGATNKGRTGQ